MQMERTFFGRHYGWAMVIGSFVFLMVIWGIVFNSNSLFLVPIERSLGISRTETMVVVTLRGLASASAGFAAGAIFSRFSFMKVIRFTGIGLFISYSLLAFVQTVWQYYLLSVIHIICITLCGMIPISMMINNWFETHKGSAMGIALMGSGIGGVIYSLLAGVLIPAIGWRATILVFGIQMLIVIIYMMYRFFVFYPGDIGMKPNGYKEPVKESVHEVEAESNFWATLLFWVVSMGILMINMGISVLISNMIPYLESRGIPFQVLSYISSVFMLSMAVGKILLGGLFDRIGMKYSSMIISISFIIACVGLLYPDVHGVIWISAVASGFGCSFNSIAPPVFAQVMYGVRNFTRVNAYFQAISSSGMVISPILVGLMYSATGNYTLTFQVFTGVMIASFFLWFFFLPSRKNE